METIPTKEIEFRKKIGKLKTDDVWHVKLKGGLHLVTKSNGKVVSAGPHRLVARHLAEKYEPDIAWTELSKSDHLPLDAYEHLLPEYQALSDQLRKLQE